MSELVEVSRLEIFVREGRESNALYLAFDVGSLMDLPVKLSVTMSDYAEERVIFRRADLVHRGMAPWPFD